MKNKKEKYFKTPRVVRVLAILTIAFSIITFVLLIFIKKFTYLSNKETQECNGQRSLWEIVFE